MTKSERKYWKDIEKWELERQDKPVVTTPKKPDLADRIREMSGADLVKAFGYCR